MPKPIFVIGHRNPDTDSICSAIVYAHMKRNLGENVLPARAGKLNAETKYVLDYFKVAPPTLISDLYPRAKDIMHEVVVSVYPWDTMREIGQTMISRKIKSLPVVDEKNTLAGIISVGDLAKRYYDELEMQDLSQTGVTFQGIVHALDGTLVCGQAVGKINGKVKIAAAKTQTMISMIDAGDVVLVGDRLVAQKACIDKGIGCLIVTGDAEVEAEVYAKAQAKGVIIIKTPHDTYTCARLINQSIPVGIVMQTQVVTFKPTDLVSDIKPIIGKTNHRKYPVVENGKLVGVIDSDRLITTEKEKIILVDHNERSQAVEGIEEARIVEIVDHHRLGGLETGEPIYIRHEPVGCTATIVANMYWHRNIEMTATIAGLLLAAIISDTVLFKSPTSTDTDKVTAEKLAKIANVNIEEFGLALLKAGSNISSMSPQEIINNDLKEFHLGEYKVAIGQISVMEPQQVLDTKPVLISAMESMLQRENFDLLLLMVTDIINEGTHLISVGKPKALLQQAFGQDADEFYLPGVMSRKKQIVPALMEGGRSLA